MATIKGEGQSKRRAAPATAPMTFHAGIPPAPTQGFGESPWLAIFRDLIGMYETSQVPVLDDGHWAWCKVRQYSTTQGARTALKQLTSDGHPWSVELGVRRDTFEYEARRNDDGSGIYVRVAGLAVQPERDATDDEE